MRTQVRKIGNSLGSIIPAVFIKQLSLTEGADIDVKAEANRIIIEPVSNKHLPFTEQELLSGLTAYTAHAEELATISSKEIGE